MDKHSNIIKTFSKHLFWDVDKLAIDPVKHSNYVINNVLQYGLYTDWKVVLDYYGLKKIVSTALKNRSLDKRTASFIATISDTPINDFSCYTTKQLIPKHWNF